MEPSFAIDSRASSPVPSVGAILWDRIWLTLRGSSRISALPLVWIMQRLLGLKPVSYLSLSSRQLAAEMESRKFLVRRLEKLHWYFIQNLFLFVMLELLRKPLLWLFCNIIAQPGTFFDHTFYSFLFYTVYGVTLLILALFVVEIFRASSVPTLQVSSRIMDDYQASFLANTTLLSIALVVEEDPRDRFARKHKIRNYVPQESAQNPTESFNTSFLPNDSQYFLRTQAQMPPQRQTYGRHSPNRSWNDGLNRSWSDGLNRSVNRSFGSSHSSHSRSTSPSCVLGAADWDPNDRMEVDTVCGRSALDKLLAQEDQLEKQRASFLQDDSLNWSSQVRDQNYQSSGVFRIPSPKRTKDENSQTDAADAKTNEQITLEDKVYPVEEYSWMQLKVSVELLHLWTENFRIWLSDTVIVPLLLRVDQVNSRLHEKLHLENVVGEHAPDQLRNIAQNYRQDIPELLQIIPFLEISMQQDYIIKRLKDLAKDGVLGDYNWNSGGSYGGQPWQDFLPTDAALVMHCFVTFLDVVLPPDPHAPNLRSFSHRYVLRNMRAWKSEQRDKPMIHQAVSSAPKYEILYNHQFLQVTEGRNNVFHTCLLFTRLMHLREKNGQGFANLGPGRVIFKIFEAIR